MLSIKKCREFLPKDTELTDDEVLKIRDALYELAEISLDSYFDECNKVSTIASKE